MTTVAVREPLPQGTDIKTDVYKYSISKCNIAIILVALHVDALMWAARCEDETGKKISKYVLPAPSLGEIS